MMSRAYSDRVMRFRRAVYGKRDGLTNGCRVLLLRLSDDMGARAIVSVPRSVLAREFDVAPARITERIAQAHQLGLLSTVCRGRPGVTAVYQGLIPDPLGTRGRTTSEEVSLVRPPGHDLVREGVPLSGSQRYARAVPQEVVGTGTVGALSSSRRKTAPTKPERETPDGTDDDPHPADQPDPGRPSSVGAPFPEAHNAAAARRPASARNPGRGSNSNHKGDRQPPSCTVCRLRLDPKLYAAEPWYTTHPACDLSSADDAAPSDLIPAALLGVVRP